MGTHRDTGEAFALLNWAQALPQSPKEPWEGIGAFPDTFGMALFLWSQLCSLCFVVCADLYLKLLKYCCATALCLFVIKVCIDVFFLHFLSACENLKFCGVPKFDSSMRNLMSKLLGFSKSTAGNSFLLYSRFLRLFHSTQRLLPGFVFVNS